MASEQEFLAREREHRKTWNPRNCEQVNPTEHFWVDHQKWLESQGYMLRPRYSPEWVPSWIGTKKWSNLCEDSRPLSAPRCHLLDATRISDGAIVGLKLIFTSKHPDEIEMAGFFSSEPLTSDHKNHCIPLLEVLKVPDYDDMFLLVMPFLRPFDDPRFLTIGEAVEFFRQMFEGLQFMHEHHIAHRDCTGRNIMMDTTALYPNGYHPTVMNRTRNFKGYAKHYTRTERPPKYYLIDFGLSDRYLPSAGPPLDLPIRGIDKTVPEFQGEGYYELSNPFHTDIYYLGNMIKEEFLDRAFGFNFMRPLIVDMTLKEPSKRPTIDQVVARFDSIRFFLSKSQLRSRIVYRKERSTPEYDGLRWWRNFFHFFRRIRFTLLFIPPVPRLEAHHRHKVAC